MTPWLGARLTRPLLAGAVTCGLVAGGAMLAAGHPGPAAVYHSDAPRNEPVTSRPLSWPAPDSNPVLAARLTSAIPARQTAGPALAVPAARTAPALGGCGLLNIGCQVDAWFAGLIVSAISPLLSMVGQTALATPQVTGIPAVQAMSAGMVGIADTVFTVLLLAGGMLLMGYQTYQTSYTIKEVAPRAVTGFVLANSTLLLIPKAIGLSNGLTGALAPGTSPASATTTLTHMLMNGEPGSGIFLVLLSGVAVVLAVVIAVTYIIRMMAVVLLAAVAPLALASYTLPQTSWAARWWWRAFGAALAIPAAQALVLTAAVKIFFSPGWTGWRSNPQLVDILITICLLYLIMRIPFWMSRPALAGFGHSPLRSGLRFAFGAAVLSRARRVLRGTPAHGSPPVRRTTSTRTTTSARGTTTTSTTTTTRSIGGGPAAQWGIRRELTAYTAPLARAAGRVARSRRSLPPGGAAAGSGPGAAPGGPPPAGGRSGRVLVPPLPGGGSDYSPRHARPPSLPAGEDRLSQPPLPAGDRPRSVPQLPGGLSHHGPVPPLPDGGTRRGPVPSLPGGPARRGPVPPLPAASTGTGIRPVPVLPPSPGSPPGRTSQRPLPGAPASRGPVPPLPGGSSRRMPAPPLPGGPDRRSPVPPLPGSRAPAAAPEPPPAEPIRRTGQHRAPPPLPAAGTSRPARDVPPLPAPPRPAPPAGQGSQPPASARTTSGGTQRRAGQQDDRPAQRQRRQRHGRAGSSPRPARRKEDPR